MLWLITTMSVVKIPTKSSEEPKIKMEATLRTPLRITPLKPSAINPNLFIKHTAYSVAFHHAVLQGHDAFLKPIHEILFMGNHKHRFAEFLI